MAGDAEDGRGAENPSVEEYGQGVIGVIGKASTGIVCVPRGEGHSTAGEGHSTSVEGEA